jgi:MGT family glycosyltransferase
MAKLAFFNLPAWGHMNPTLPVVSELIRRGESVVYYNNREFRSAIEATGAAFRPYEPPVTHEASKAASSVFKLAAAVLETSLDLLPRLLRDLETDLPEYIIHDSVCPWGRFAAEVLRIPAIASTTTFALNAELFVPKNPLARLWMIPAALLQELPRLRRIREFRGHLESVYGLKATRIFDVVSNPEPLNVVYTSRKFQPRSDLFDETYEFVGASIRPGGGEDSFASELGDDPVIYVALGTIFNDSPAFYRACIEAFGGAKQRVVISLGANQGVGDLGPLPDNVLVRRWVPQLLVLSKASLFLTRCGINSVTESLFYGVPMLLFPEIMEQRLVARQVIEAGAGVELSERKLKPEDLRRQAERVLGTPEFREAARRIGESLRAAGGYERAAEAILNYRARRLGGR